MKTIFHGRAARAALALGLMATATPMVAPVPAFAQGQSQDPAEARLRKIEAELRAVQRKVFPDGAGKTFAPEITAPQPAPATPAGAPTSTPVADLLARMDAVEAQLQRLTAASEEGQDRMNKLEARIAALEPPPPPAPAEAVPTTPAAPAVAAPAPLSAPAPVVAKPAPAPTVKPAPQPAPKPASPSADRVAAVEAIAKPASGDAGEDEYSYGYRLWEAKFFPEAQQQLTRYVQTYPKHKRISYARNLLGRAYLDDNKPGTAAQWFLQNYQADKQGDRAADSLLYLGVAMAKLKETKRACVAFAEFRNVYATEAAGRLKSQLDAAGKAVTCN